MPRVAELISNPDFELLPDTEKLKLMASVEPRDEDFQLLSDEEKQKLRDRLVPLAPIPKIKLAEPLAASTTRAGLTPGQMFAAKRRALAPGTPEDFLGLPLDAGKEVIDALGKAEFTSPLQPITEELMRRHPEQLAIFHDPKAPAIVRGAAGAMERLADTAVSMTSPAALATLGVAGSAGPLGQLARVGFGVAGLHGIPEAATGIAEAVGAGDPEAAGASVADLGSSALMALGAKEIPGIIREGFGAFAKPGGGVFHGSLGTVDPETGIPLAPWYKPPAPAEALSREPAPFGPRPPEIENWFHRAKESAAQAEALDIPPPETNDAGPSRKKISRKLEGLLKLTDSGMQTFQPLGEAAIARSEAIFGQYRETPEVQAHEIFHRLGDFYSEAPWMKLIHDTGEMPPIASAGADPQHDGFAEFGRLFVTDPVTAAKYAPKTMELFVNGLTETDPYLLNRLESIQNDYALWAEAGGGAATSMRSMTNNGASDPMTIFGRRIKAAVNPEVWADAFDKMLYSIVRGTGGHGAGIAEYALSLVKPPPVPVYRPGVKPNFLYKEFVNRQGAAHKVDNYIAASTGAGKGNNLQADWSAEAWARLNLARMDKAMTFIKVGPIDIEGWQTGAEPRIGGGPSLRSIYEPLAASEWDDLSAYANLRRVAYLDSLPNKTPEQVGAVARWLDALRQTSIDGVHKSIAKYDAAHPELFNTGYKLVQVYKNSVNKYAFDAGLIDRETLDFMNAHEWVPWQRFIGELAPLDTLGKALTGTGTESIEPLHEALVKHTMGVIMAAEKARTATRTLDILSQAPGGGRLAFRAAPPIEQLSMSVADLGTAMEKEIGYDPTKDMPKSSREKLANLYYQSFHKPTILDPDGYTDFATLREGKPEFWKINNDIIDFVTNVGPLPGTESLPLKIMAAYTQVFRTLIVNTPQFLLRQWPKDAISAYANVGATPGATLLRGLIESIPKSDAYNQARADGALMSGIMGLAASERRGIVGHYLAEGRKASDAGSMVVENVHRLQDIMTRMFEEAHRVGVHKARLEDPYSQDVTPLAQHMRAGFEARDSAIDFAVAGAYMNWYRRYVAFMNPAIQALRLSAKTWRDYPERAAILTAAYITEAFVRRLIIESDPEAKRAYNRYPGSQRDLFHALPAKWLGYKPVLVAKNQEWGIISTLTERLVIDPLFEGNLGDRSLREVLADPNTKPEWAKAMRAMYMTMIPDVMPNLLRIQNGLATNYDSFSGRQIVDQNMQGMPTELQYKDSTSWAAKKLGGAVGISPLKIDYAIRSGLGYAGKTTSDMLDIINEPARPAASMWSSLPGLSAFIGKYPLTGGAPLRNFYDQYAEYQAYLKGQKVLADRGEKPPAMEAYRARHSEWSTIDSPILAKFYRKAHTDLIRMGQYVGSLGGKDYKGDFTTAQRRSLIEAGIGDMMAYAERVEEIRRNMVREGVGQKPFPLPETMNLKTEAMKKITAEPIGDDAVVSNAGDVVRRLPPPDQRLRQEANAALSQDAGSSNLQQIANYLARLHGIRKPVIVRVGGTPVSQAIRGMDGTRDSYTIQLSPDRAEPWSVLHEMKHVVADEQGAEADSVKHDNNSIVADYLKKGKPYRQGTMKVELVNELRGGKDVSHLMDEMSPSDRKAITRAAAGHPSAILELLDMPDLIETASNGNNMAIHVLRSRQGQIGKLAPKLVNKALRLLQKA